MQFHCTGPKRAENQDERAEGILPRAVAEMLVERRKTIDELKELLGDEYRDYDLVFATTQGTPTEANYINRAFGKLIADNNLPQGSIS